VLKNSDSRTSNILRAAGSLAVSTRANHVWLEESSFEHYMVVREELIAGSKDFLRDNCTTLQGVFSVHENFRFHNGDKSVGLANSSIASKSSSILINGKLGWGTRILDVQYSTPFCEACTLIVVFLAASTKVSDSLGDSLAVSTRKRLDALVHLDTRDNTLLLEFIGEEYTAIVLQTKQ
jgi:hypothetical protein